MIKNFICGSWELVQCKLFSITNEKMIDPLDGADGLLIYNNIGIMSVQIMWKNHRDSIPANAHETSLENYAAAFKSYAAYYGRYEINEKDSIITHFVKGASWPTMIDMNLSRSFQIIEPNILKLRNVNPEDMIDGIEVFRELLWRKVS